MNDYIYIYEHVDMFAYVYLDMYADIWNITKSLVLNSHCLDNRRCIFLFLWSSHHEKKIQSYEGDFLVYLTILINEIKSIMS